MMKNCRILSGSALKLIALACMVADHVTVVGARVWPWMLETLFTVGNTRVTPAFIGSAVIGRIAFPLFAFLCVEGFEHTRSLGRYMGTMLVFALLSIVPFNLLKGHEWYYWHNMNVLFTLLLGLCGMYCMRNFKGWKAAAGVLASLAVAFFGRCDYGPAGVALIILIYLLKNPTHKCLAVFAVFARSKYTICAALASAPILLYNGQRGFIRGRVWKLAFYAFYPLHILLILALIAQ